MNVKKLALGAYQTNCYLLWEGDQAVVIDPGYEADTILRALDTLGIPKEEQDRIIEAIHRSFERPRLEVL